MHTTGHFWTLLHTPHIRMSKYIDLKSFRKRNRLTQGAIATFLGTSKGYISLVENGKSDIADENLRNLYLEEKWDSRSLIPYWTRFLDAWEVYNTMKGEKSPGTFWPLEDENPFGFSTIEVEMLFEGISDFDESMVRRIIEKIPNINPRWLTHGESPMLLRKESYEGQTILKLEGEIEQLKDRLKKIETYLESLRIVGESFSTQ